MEINTEEPSQKLLSFKTVDPLVLHHCIVLYNGTWNNLFNHLFCTTAHETISSIIYFVLWHMKQSLQSFILYCGTWNKLFNPWLWGRHHQTYLVGQSLGLWWWHTSMPWYTKPTNKSNSESHRLPFEFEAVFHFQLLLFTHKSGWRHLSIWPFFTQYKLEFYVNLGFLLPWDTTFAADRVQNKMSQFPFQSHPPPDSTKSALPEAKAIGNLGLILVVILVDLFDT